MKPLTMELKVENRLAEVSRVNALFNSFCSNNGIPDSIRRKFNTAFDELLSNIIAYAYEDEQIHLIGIVVTYDGSKISVQITDDGIEFDPFKVAEPDLGLGTAERPFGGLGIYLVRKMMDEHGHERRGEKNIIRLAKFIK